VPGQRVGYVLKKFPRLSETFILNEVLGVERSGLDVTVFSLRPPDDEPRHHDTSNVRADVLVVERSNGTSLGKLLDDIGRQHGDDTADRVASFISKLPVDRQRRLVAQARSIAAEVDLRGITHLHAHFVTIAAHTAYVVHLLTGVSFTCTAHAKDIYRHGIDRDVFTEVVTAARSLVTVCHANERHIRAKLVADPSLPIDVIANGLPLDMLPAADPNISREQFILAVGRLVEKKGFDILIDACAALRDAGRPIRCVIAGGGDEFDRLVAQVAQRDLGGLVDLLGPVTRDRVIDLMRRATLLAVPCVTGADGNRDALPTVVLEAMAVGLPVVATPVGGIEEMIQHDVEGIIVPERDVSGLAAAITSLFDEAPMHARMSTAGPARVAAEFTQDATLPRLIELFTSATNPA
jgi:glycosyltransferase involved in cell wall biosynthesis